MFADDLQPAGSRQMEQVISCGTLSTNSTSPLIIQISRVEKSWREVMTYEFALHAPGFIPTLIFIKTCYTNRNVFASVCLH